jgi:hypothetical protein
LNDEQIPNFRCVRVHVSTGYNSVEGNRRASRNGLVSVLPPENPHVTIRNFSSLILSSARVVAARATLAVAQDASSYVRHLEGKINQLQESISDLRASVDDDLPRAAAASTLADHLAAAHGGTLSPPPHQPSYAHSESGQVKRGSCR